MEIAHGQVKWIGLSFDLRFKSAFQKNSHFFAELLVFSSHFHLLMIHAYPNCQKI